MLVGLDVLVIVEVIVVDLGGEGFDVCCGGVFVFVEGVVGVGDVVCFVGVFE